MSKEILTFYFLLILWLVIRLCTCINIAGKNSYFGRNLDLDYSFNERLIITPRNYKINFKFQESIVNHYSFIGIGTIIDDYPLYAEASKRSFDCWFKF